MVNKNKFQKKFQDPKVVFMLSLVLLLVGVIASLLALEKSGRDEDMKFFDKITNSGNQQTVTTTDKSAKGTGIANPASTNCLDKGGKLVLQNQPTGQFDVCVFDGGQECEEWALLRGECPEGGVKISGYTTQASRFCVVIGGAYTVTKAGEGEAEQGSCKFKNGKSCDAGELWNGKCTKEEA